MKSQIIGQVSFWDMESIEECINVIQTVNPLAFTKLPDKEINTKNDKIDKAFNITDKQQEFINKNLIMENENLSRLIFHCSGELLIEFLNGNEYKTIKVSKDGIKEVEFNKKSTVLPMDKIIYYKGEFRSNNIQEKKLLGIKDNGFKTIRRKGDENIIVLKNDKVISINNKGWVLEFEGIEAIYDETEVVCIESKNISEDEEIKVGNMVEVIYGEDKFKGIVTRIYNNGDTINCIFNNKHSAFYKTFVKKIKAA
ncbi:MAG: hypothetical protein RR891_02665 [Clostridium sp.]